MRRSTFVIGLTTSLAAVALATLIYNIDSRQSQRADNSARNAVGQVQEIPMTAVQIDRMLEILNEIQYQDLAVPGAEAERGSIERLEYQLAKIDERDRLIFEQASSVLSAAQVEYLFEWYQHDSYRRADALERQKKARADDNPDDLPLHYPGRTDPDIR